MKLVTVTGFLGSGKTTVMLQLAARLSSEKHKTAVLINEIGDVGIDNRHMKQLGHNVWELTGGCICCSLKIGLIETLIQLKKEQVVEIVLLEPSGAADPGNILDTIDTTAAIQIEAIKNIAVVDPLRAYKLFSVLKPLCASIIRNSDIVLANKCDIASKDELDFVVKWVKEIDESLPVYDVSAKNGLSEELIGELIDV